MSQSSYTPFQKHLLFFATPTTPPQLTFLSSLRATCSIGLALPVSVLLSLALRILYAPYPLFWRPILLDEIPRSAHRTQLESATLPQDKAGYTCADLVRLLGHGAGAWLARKIDQAHVMGFWAMAADAQTCLVSREDVRRFQQGEWEAEVVKRRRGRGDVLPVWRGGPVGVAAHSWAVGRLLGVRVYERKRE